MRVWKWILWIGIALFLLSRLVTLLSFPIFNDEGIYLQYSQAIHSDFSKYKFISEGGLYADWKPPLQYWFGSPFFGLTHDPLLAGRLAVFAMSLFGLWGLYLFIKELLGEKEAALAVLLYALCPPALFYNNQFVAETFVFSLAPWMYWFFLRATRPYKVGIWYALGGAVFGALLLLSKQSGMVYMVLALLLPLIYLDHRKQKGPSGKRDWRGFFIRLGLIIGALALAKLFSLIGISRQTAGLESKFNANWLMSASQVLAFPIAIWKTNWESIRDYYSHYYSVFILLPILYFFYVALRRRQLKDIAIGLGFVGGSLAILLLLKGFNEYIYNTAVIVFLVPLLVRAFFAAWESARGSERLPRAMGGLVLLSFALLAGHWAYQDVLMKASPAGYIRRGTPWMVENYLQNWSGGFGVAETIDYVKNQPGPGLVLADPQWGNPRTALEIYNADYPTLRVVGITADFQTPEGAQKLKNYILQQKFKTNLVVFSAARNSLRAVWQDNAEKYLCTTRKEIQVQPTQPPIIICSF